MLKKLIFGSLTRRCARMCVRVRRLQGFNSVLKWGNLVRIIAGH